MHTSRNRTSRASLAALLVLGACFALGTQSRAQAWRGVPVFMYHKVNPVLPSDAVGRDLTLTPAQFAEQLRFLQAAHVRTLTARDLVAALERGEEPRRVAVLTFDDGYADNAVYALPLLQRYGARATFFIITGTLGTPHHLTWAQVRALRDAGMEIAAHGSKHIDLTELDAHGQRSIAQDCIRSLARMTGVSAQTYAYPAGAYNALTIDVMHDAGLKAAFTTIPGYVKSLERRFELPRFRVHNDGAAALMRGFFSLREAVARRPAQVDVNAAARAGGNRKAEAIALARVLLAREWPAQLTKVRIDAAGSHAVAGLVVVGSKFHRPLSRAGFAQEAAALLEIAFAHSPVEEVDLWATVPLSAPMGAAVSGDMAVPTSKIVFSITARRSDLAHRGGVALVLGRSAFWDPAWVATLAAEPKGRSPGSS